MPNGIEEAVQNTALLDSEAEHRKTIENLVSAFTTQDLDRIMSLFAEASRYCDIRGADKQGTIVWGKNSIRRFYERQFDVMGEHTFEDATIVVDGDTAFASWTLVLGNSNDPLAPRFEGSDHFELNEHSEVTLKKAWLKGLSRLHRQLILRRPIRLIRNTGFLLEPWLRSSGART